MRIDRLTLRNFRNIGDEEQTFRFNPHFTVVIGINGRGKSTILHGLRVACGTFFLGIPDVSRRHITPHEIHLTGEDKNLVRARPVCVEAEGTFGNNPEQIVWRRQIPQGSNSTTSSDADVGKMKNRGQELYRQVIGGNDQVTLPVIAYFGISRLHGGGRKRTSRYGRIIFEDGYKNWDDMKASTFKYEDWLASYDILAESDGEYDKTKEAFEIALKLANPYIKELRILNGQLRLRVKIDDSVSKLLPLAYHSDGIRIFTEMVAELAYRCIVLNGYQNELAISESIGVVMIDELDLHLHPTWQRHVVGDLRAAFPNIQFVATSHSPFIVQSLDANEIWNLDKPMDVSPNDFNLNTVATAIMGVPSPYSEENQKAYEQSKDILGQLNSPDVDLEKIKQQLEEIDDPGLRAFLELQSHSR